MTDLERVAGYVPIARKLFDGGDLFWPTPFKDRFSRGEAWVDLIQMAAFRHDAVVNGVRLNRGEVCGSLRWLGRRWGWTVKEVRGFLAMCEGNRRIQARTKARTWARTPSVYALLNYDAYNPINDEKGTDQATHLGTDRARTGHNDEEGKKGRSTDTPPDPVLTPPVSPTTPAHGNGRPDPIEAEFAGWWTAYPKRAGSNPRKDALKSYRARRGEGITRDALFAGRDRYRRWAEATEKINTEFVMQAVTFLSPRREGWAQPWDLPADHDRDHTGELERALWPDEAVP